MKKVIMNALLIGSLTIMTTGCAYKSIEHGTEITDEKVLEIQNGKTTKNDIVLMFGDPSKIMNNEKIYFYTWTRGSKGHFLGFGQGNAHTKSLVVVFDENDLVKNRKITRGTTSADSNIND
jgi:outer membrane protein assembly factor BamE (lipoprotein component of BamABCDE complex)